MIWRNINEKNNHYQTKIASYYQDFTYYEESLKIVEELLLKKNMIET